MASISPAVGAMRYIHATRAESDAFRHQKAVDLLESGVNLVYIRDFLGYTRALPPPRYTRRSASSASEEF